MSLHEAVVTGTFSGMAMQVMLSLSHDFSGSVTLAHVKTLGTCVIR